jgi:hypothetical protein
MWTQHFVVVGLEVGSGSVVWPLRCFNLARLDVFLWGHPKSFIHDTSVVAEEDQVPS